VFSLIVNCTFILSTDDVAINDPAVARAEARLVIAARASEHLRTSVADSLSGKGLSCYIPKEV